MAVLCAELDAARRKMRKLRANGRRMRADFRAAELAAFHDLFAWAVRLTTHALTRAGWHCHHRGEWRRTRGTTTAVVTTDAVLATWVPADVSAAAGDMDDLDRQAAGKGDKSILSAVDEYLTNPAAVALWGDTGRHLLLKWVRLAAGENLVMVRATLRFASDLRGRLAGDRSDALALLCAERVVPCWVTANLFARAVSQDMLPKTLDHYQRWADLGHRQLMAAIRTLAKVRRAKLPDLLAVVNVTVARLVEPDGLAPTTS